MLRNIFQIAGLFKSWAKPTRYNCPVKYMDLMDAIHVMPEGDVDPQVRRMVKTVARHLPGFNYLVENIDQMNKAGRRFGDPGFSRTPQRFDMLAQHVRENFYVQTYDQRIGQFRHPR